MALPELKQAPAQDVTVYMPFYREQNKRSALPYAIYLYKQGELQGERAIEGSAPVSFMARWKPSNLPLDMIVCSVIFEGDNELSYEIQIQSAEFVGYLVETVAMIRDKAMADFPQPFYFKLFRIKPAGEAA